MTAERVIEWGTAGAALGGGVSGDLHVVATFDGGALVGAIDGLGHGPEAAAAANAAARVLEENPGEELTDLFARCHEALRPTRGAVMSLASFDARADRLTWLGVGNVDAVLVRPDGKAREALAPRGGVVGYQLPPMHAASTSIDRGDLVVFATDGVRWGFAADLACGESPGVIAETVLARYAKHDDDALVVVARYLGAS
jgi:serine phosphatase RsbU (regulator of sigma subunit)